MKRKTFLVSPIGRLLVLLVVSRMAHSGCRADCTGTIDCGKAVVGTTNISSGWIWYGCDCAFQTQTIVGPDAADFSLSTNYTGVYLPLGQNFPFSVIFTPSRAGIEEAGIYYYQPGTGCLSNIFHLTGRSFAPAPPPTPPDTPYANAVLSLHPVAYWPLNEIASPFLDVVENSSLLCLSESGLGFNDVIQGQLGVVGGSFRFSNALLYLAGLGSHVDIPYSSGLNPNGPFTVELWVKPAQLVTDIFCPASSVDVSPYGTNRFGWVFYQTGNNNWQFRVEGSNGIVAMISGGSAQAGVWSHLVGVYDGANISLYVNGQLAAGPAPAPGFAANRRAPLRLGANSLAFRTFDGWVDEVAFYTNALAASKIAAHFSVATNNNGGYADQILADYPTGYWHLDEPAYSTPSYLCATNFGSFSNYVNGSYWPGTMPGAVGAPLSGFGTNNYACGFNGSAGYVAVHGPPLNVTGPLTIIAWAKTEPANGTYQMIADKGDSSFQLGMEPLGHPFFGNGATNTAMDVVGPMRMDDGQWHQMVGVYDGVGTNYLYFDGALAASGAAPAPLTGSSYDFLIGGTLDYATERLFDGTIDEVAVFTNALSPAQILQTYFSATNGPATGNAPTIAEPPQSQDRYRGESLSFNVTTTGTQPLSYQWQVNGANLADGLRITGSKSSALIIASAVTCDSGQYRVVVANTFGAVTSPPAQLNVLTVHSFPAGGVISLIAEGASPANPAYLQVRLGPAAAVQAGAGWRLGGDATFGTSQDYTRAVVSTNATIEFAAVSGWKGPATNNVVLSAGNLTVLSNVLYTPQPPTVLQPPVHSSNGLSLTWSSTVGQRYQVQYKSSLTQGTWSNLGNALNATNSTASVSAPLSVDAQRFYRLMLVP